MIKDLKDLDKFSFNYDLFKQRFKEERERHGLSQGFTAKILGVDKSYISNFEIGKRKPSIEMLIKIALMYDVSTDYLVGLSDKRKIATK